MNTALSHGALDQSIISRRADKTGQGMLGSGALYMLIYLSITEARRVAWHKLGAQLTKAGVTLADMQILADQGWIELTAQPMSGHLVSITEAGDQCVRNVVEFLRLGGAAK